MQKIQKHAIYLFLVIFGLTALMSLGGLGYRWWQIALGAELKDFPFLNWLLAISIAEVIGVVIFFTKSGLKYLPKIVIN